MSSTANPESKQNDYSNFRWVPGAFQGDSISISQDTDGGFRLGARGYDKRHSGPGYISIKLTPAAITEAIRLLQAAQAGQLPPAPKSKTAAGA